MQILPRARRKVGDLEVLRLRSVPGHTADQDKLRLDRHPRRATPIFILTEEFSASHAARHAAGWESCLDRLERGADSERWQLRFERYVAAFTPLFGQQDGPPEGYHEPND